MKDEKDLASLVLLLQLPASSTDDNATNELQLAFEHDDCRLLCFSGRLINSYASAREKSDGSLIDVNYSLLRLSVRILLMRYASYATYQETSDEFDERIFEWEKCLVRALLRAIKASAEIHSLIQNVDVEISWCIVGLLMRWSGQLKQDNASNTENNEEIAKLWIESIEVTMARYSSHTNDQKDQMTVDPGVNNQDASGTSDEILMVRTINSLLDDTSENESLDEGANRENELGTALASCFRAYLDHHTKSKVPQSVLIGLIHCSQQKDSISVDFFSIILNYLNSRLHHALSERDEASTQLLYGRNWSKFGKYFFSDNGNGSSSVEPFVAIKSFLFYGLIVLCIKPGSDSITLNNTACNETHVNRGDIYFAFLGFWQLLGPEWLYEKTLNTDIGNTSASTINDWWQQSDFSHKNSKSKNQLGQTWQLCTLIRLAAGEFRLSMGRWMASIEENRTGTESYTLSEIVSSAQIVVQAVQLMITLADEEDNEMQCSDRGAVWTPDAILHTQQSLQDALNASIQFFNENDFSNNSSLHNALRSEWEDIGRTCCLILGTFAPELELDQLLICHQNDESDTSSFCNALCACLTYCNTVVKQERSDTNASTNQIEQEEPLSCILPCIMSIIDIAKSGYDRENKTNKLAESAQNILVSLCNNGQFIEILSGFLRRLHTRLMDCNGELGMRTSIITLAKLASVIGNEALEIENSSSQMLFTDKDSDKLSAALLLWNNSFL